MNNKFNNLIQELTNQICSENFSWVHIALLLVYLRPSIRYLPLLYDLTNFVPHGDVRDSGISHKTVKAYLWNFICVAESSRGTIVGSQSVFKKSLLLNQLLVGLDSLKIKYDKKVLLRMKT